MKCLKSLWWTKQKSHLQVISPYKPLQMRLMTQETLLHGLSWAWQSSPKGFVLLFSIFRLCFIKIICSVWTGLVHNKHKMNLKSLRWPCKHIKRMCPNALMHLYLIVIKIAWMRENYFTCLVALPSWSCPNFGQFSCALEGLVKKYIR